MQSETTDVSKLKTKHVINSRQFSKDFLDNFFKRTKELKTAIESGQGVEQTLAGKCMVSLFYEASTRTRLSFERAGHKLGMQIIGSESAGQFSSAAKGETLEDSITVLGGYHPDVIILRHSETGAAYKAAKISEIPVINAGDGSGQHPTQSLIDMFTINDLIGRCDNLNIVAGGDLSRGRTIRSLCYLLAKYPGNKISFVSPESQRMRSDVIDHLKKSGVEISEHRQPDDVLPDADVVYWTRTQRERGSDDEEEILIDAKAVKTMKPKSILMHPLPRIDEITTDVDDLPQAAYFEQASNGLFVRMALLEYVVG